MKEKNVQPLRTAKEIEDMKWALRRYSSERDYFLLVFGINTGLRVSDMVPLTVGDVRGKTHVVIREKKTNKTKRFMLPVKLREEIEDYTAHMSDEEYLFVSRKGNGPITCGDFLSGFLKKYYPNLAWSIATCWICPIN